MKNNIFGMVMGVFVSVGVHGVENALYKETKLPSDIQLVFEAKLSNIHIVLLNVKYDVVTQYPYLRIFSGGRSKSYQLIRFSGHGWQAYHKNDNIIYGLLDNEIESPGSVFSIIRVSDKGEITYIGDIRKNHYYETHVKSYIKGNILAVVTENDFCEYVQITTYEFNLDNYSTSGNSPGVGNKSRPC